MPVTGHERFCGFCPCDRCRDGESYLTHAPTDDGRWVCEVCHEYDLCLRAGHDPCGAEHCSSRPTLVGEFVHLESQP